ncbi:PaaI family thioesterase [Sphingobium sp. Sx8-8]|uniref:PaaI family thioesterase n=1 Tax=Sphingobium sp. Sx8-8 TaxID=2933617 RepID=UPI001F562897|nr:PaaI family thioesterase [Sphingobium sp. Sx8-8]
MVALAPAPDFFDRAAAQQPPPGFDVMPLNFGFLGINGPVFKRIDEDGRVIFGCRIMPSMCNPMGVSHGGWLATMIDIVLPLTVRLTDPDFFERFLMTVSLNIDYLAGPKEGEWLEGTARILRKTKRLLFIDGTLTVGDETVTRASGIFRVGPPAPPLGT